MSKKLKIKFYVAINNFDFELNSNFTCRLQRHTLKFPALYDAPSGVYRVNRNRRIDRGKFGATLC